MARAITQPGPERANRLILIGAVALAALAAVLVFVALSNFGGGSSSGVAGGDVDVVVAARDIDAGVPITSDMLSTATLPARSTVEGALTDKSAAVGLTSRYPLIKNEQVSTGKLGQTSNDKAAGPLPVVVPSGMRAIALPVTETTGAGGLLVPGDHVDIIAINDKSGGGNVSSASTILQNVQVLAVAQNVVNPTPRIGADGKPVEGSISTSPSDTDANPDARSVTVAVSPEDAAIVALAQEQGKIYLSVRPVDDSASVPGLEAPRSLPNP